MFDVLRNVQLTSVCEKTSVVLPSNITKSLYKKKIILIFKNATHHRNFPLSKATFVRNINTSKMRQPGEVYVIKYF